MPRRSGGRAGWSSPRSRPSKTTSTASSGGALPGRDDPVSVKLTGSSPWGVSRRTDEAVKHGSLVEPHLYAPNHQHFFNMRLDIYLDGTANTVYRVDVVLDLIDEENLFENAFQARATPLRSEKEAARGTSTLETARTWKVVNPDVRNSRGASPWATNSCPATTRSPSRPPTPRRKRARFVDHHVWVTPYRPDEPLRSAGDYPNQSHGGDGLPRWTEQDRPITNTDVVLWYTFGHTHIPPARRIIR